MAVWAAMVRFGDGDENTNWTTLRAKFRIQNPKASYNAGDTLGGTTYLTNCGGDSYSIECVNIDLECLASVNFEHRFDGRSQKKSSQEKIIDEEWSKITVPGQDGQLILIKPEETLEFPFTFHFPTSGKLPGSFRGLYGNVHYNLIASIKLNSNSGCRYGSCRLASKRIQVRGFLDLVQEPTASLPILYEKSMQKSYFSRKTPMNFCFAIRQTGFIAQENINFELTLNNPNMEKITKITSSLIQRVVFNAEGSTKSIIAILATKTLTKLLGDKASSSASLQQLQIVWGDTIIVPNDLHPTFSGLVAHQYCIRVGIEYDSSVLKGELPLIIGTTRAGADNADFTSTSKVSDSTFTTSGKPVRLQHQRRMSLPPSYSQLSSRRSSTSSITSITSVETLPPTYEMAAFTMEDSIKEAES